jgi:hypothetical protein
VVWVEEEEEVKGEEEWVAADWAQPENADAQIVAIQCCIKRGCHAISRPVQNAGLK